MPQKTNDEKMMKDLLQLLREIVPLLESVRNSIQDSSSKIPKAAAQLSKVTEATETATVEILDLVEKLTARMNDASKRIEILKSKIEASKNEASSYLDQIETHLTTKGYTAEVRALLKNLRTVTESEHVIKSISDEAALFSDTVQDYMTISIALQVQDITNQQISGVKQMIDNVYSQLADALRRFDKGVMDPMPEETPRVSTFDSDAQYSKTPERQMTADEIVKEWNQLQK